MTQQAATKGDGDVGTDGADAAKAAAREFKAAGGGLPRAWRRWRTVDLAEEVRRGMAWEAVPHPSSLGLHPKASLSKILEHYADVVRIEPCTSGPARVVAVVSRATALGLAEQEATAGDPDHDVDVA